MARLACSTSRPAEHIYALGVPDKTIQMIECHANLNTTMEYYIESAPDDAIAAMGRLESAVPKRAKIGQQIKKLNVLLLQ